MDIVTIPPLSDEEAEDMSPEGVPVHAIIHIAEGNPGAITAIRAIADASDGSTASFLIGALEALEIRGSLVWLCYKDICKYDADLLIDQIRNGRIAKDLEALPYSGYKKP